MKRLLILLLFAIPAFAQTQIQSGPVDPVTCDPQIGQLWFNNSTVPAVLKYCSAINTWTAVGSGTGGTVFPWTVLSSSGTPSLTVNNGSANYYMSVTSNVTAVTLSGTPAPNGTYIGIDFQENGTGGFTIPTGSFPGNFIFPSGCAFNTAANANNWLAWTYDGTNWQPVPGACGGAGGLPVGPNNTVQIYNSGVLGAGPLSTTLQIKPQTSDNICYVSVNGNDSNDGLSIGTAKLTVYSCLTTVLPGGDSTHAGNGTVLLSGNPSYGGPVTNQGFWLMGPVDPNYASPPSGWLKNSGSATITLDCFAAYIPGTHGHTGHCGMVGGSNVTPNTPSVWISGIAGNITLNNISFPNSLGNYIKYGIDSNNNRNGTGGSSGLALNNLTMNPGNCTATGQSGPIIDIGSNSFWIWMNNNTIGGCQSKIFTIASSGAVRTSGVTTITTTAANDISTNDIVTIANVTDDSFNGSFGGPPGVGNNNLNSVVTVIDSTHFTYTNPGPNTTSGTGQVITARSAAINMDSGTTGTGTGLIFIDNTNLNGGEIRYSLGQNGGGFYVDKVSYEGNGSQPDPPVILITGVSSTSNGDGTNIRVDNVEIADNNNIAPGVQVDNGGGLHPDVVIVSRIAGYVRGNMTVMGNASVTIANKTASYLRQQQWGMRNGQIIATGIDVARRGFSPVLAKGTNLANQSPSTWTFSNGTGTVTSGIAAPDGTNNAGRVTFSTGVPQANIQFYGNSTPLNVGDIYIFGVWARSVTANGYATGGPPINFVFNSLGLGNGDVCTTSPGSPTQTSATILGNFTGSQLSDGQWAWYSGVCKVAANPTGPGTSFFAYVDATHTLDLYAPTLFIEPSGTISDNEGYELAINMAPWASSAVPGEISMLPGQRLHEGTTTFANLGTPNNGSEIYCTDCVVFSNPCVGTGTGAFAQGINGAWVCGGGGGGSGCPPGGSIDALQYNGGGTCAFGGTNSPTVNGNFVVNYRITAGAQVPPTITRPGVPVNPQTGTTYTEGSANTDSDRGYLITANNAASQTYTLTNPSTLGFELNYFNVLKNIGAGAVTENASGFTINGGSSLFVPSNWTRFLWSDGVNDFASRFPDFSSFPNCATAITFSTSTGAFGCGASGAVSSWSGDGALFNNVSSTGAVTATLGNASANTVWGRCLGTSGVPSYCQITDAMLTAVSHAALTNQANTYSGGGLQDFSAMTWKIPTSAGFTAGATTMLGYDTTNQNAHIYSSNADAIVGAFATAPGNNNCLKGSVSSGKVLIVDTGSGCAVNNPPFDKSATGLTNPTADATFTQPNTSTSGWTLAGTAPASVSTATGTNATSLFNVNGVTGGADSNATGTAGVGSSPTISAGNGGAGTGTNAVGGAGGVLTFTAGNGGASLGTGANANGGNVVVTPGAAGSGGSGSAGHAGVLQVGPAECTVPGTGGGLCAGEGSEPTNVSGAATFVADSSTHEWMAATNGASTATPGMMVRVQPSPINQTAKVAAITTATLCASSAGACNVAGQYHVHINVWGSGTACATPSPGGVTPSLTWTDENAVTHSVVVIPMMSQSSATAVAVVVTAPTVPFESALANEGGSGDFTISTNGSVIQYAVAYTACGSGTGTYNLRAAVTRVQ